MDESKYMDNPTATAALRGVLGDQVLLIDGNNLMPALKGEGEWPTKSFIYWTDGGSVAALRLAGGRQVCRSLSRPPRSDRSYLADERQEIGRAHV